jgi:L-arabinose isomerase
MSQLKRLQRLEHQYLGRLVQPEAEAYGVDVEELLDEARRFFALSDAEQDAEFADALAQAQARGDHEAVRILTHGWAAVRSYR